jgi:lipoprotein-anchoring transpeptidase ErfK/SrfK
LVPLVVVLAAAVCAGVLAAEPGATSEPDSVPAAEGAPGSVPSQAALPTAPSPPPSPPPTTSAASPPAVVARAAVPSLGVFRTAGDLAPFLTLPDTTQFGTPLHLLVTAEQPDWVQVLIPLRPNGTFGWVHRSEVDLGGVADVVTVDLAAHTLTWARSGQVLVQAPVAVGRPSTPTPRGTFFVTDLIETDPGGEYGPAVVALSGYSEAIDLWHGQPARIAIHGTDAPGTIGLDASNGCVRVANDLDAFLAHSLPLGTPVILA